MRPTPTILLMLALAPLPALAQEPFDHHDPAALVAHARQASREGDFRTACVLLSRAGQLAPHDVRIQLAWGDWAAAQNGVPISDAAALPTVAPAAPKKDVAPAPPAPWPVKK